MIEWDGTIIKYIGSNLLIPIGSMNRLERVYWFEHRNLLVRLHMYHVPSMNL